MFIGDVEGIFATFHFFAELILRQETPCLLSSCSTSRRQTLVEQCLPFFIVIELLQLTIIQLSRFLIELQISHPGQLLCLNKWINRRFGLIKPDIIMFWISDTSSYFIINTWRYLLFSC
jgi:hypothetical protein